MPPETFVVQYCVGYPDFLFFHMYLGMVLLGSVKNCVGILMGVALNL